MDQADWPPRALAVMRADAAFAQGRGISAPDLRALVVCEMANDWQNYAPFIEDRLHATGTYLTNMAPSTEYAGEAELFALSSCVE